MKAEAKEGAVVDENVVEAAVVLRLEQWFVYQHGNDPKHTTRTTTEWLTKSVHGLQQSSSQPVMYRNLAKEVDFLTKSKFNMRECCNVSSML